MRALALIAVVVGLIVVGGNTADGEAEKASPSQTVNVTAEMVVDYVERTSEGVSAFCSGYSTLSNEELALETFSATYSASEPSAREVFYEYLSRC